MEKSVNVILCRIVVHKASTTLSLDMCPDFMEVVVRRASFPCLISQSSLIFHHAVSFNSQLKFHVCSRLFWGRWCFSCHTSIVWCQDCEVGQISHFISNAHKTPSQIGFWAEHFTWVQTITMLVQATYIYLNKLPDDAIINHKESLIYMYLNMPPNSFSQRRDRWRLLSTNKLNHCFH